MTNSDQTLYYEQMPSDDVWVVVCEKHANHDHNIVELTAEMKEVPVGALSQIVDDLTDE